MRLSTCCDAQASVSDICSECGEHADFYDDEEDDDGEMKPKPNINEDDPNKER